MEYKHFSVKLILQQQLLSTAGKIDYLRTSFNIYFEIFKVF